MGFLSARFSGLGTDSLVVVVFADASATGTSEKELGPISKIGFDLSTWTEVELKSSGQQTSKLKGSTKFTIPEKVRPDTSLKASSGSLNFAAIPKSVAKIFT